MKGWSESVLSWKEKTTQQSFSFLTDWLNIIFDDFDIWLLGFRIQFNCLYIPQGHYFKYFVAACEVQTFDFERKSTFNKSISTDMSVIPIFLPDQEPEFHTCCV